MTAEQEALVVSHMRIVAPIAKRMIKKFGLPYWIDIDEMISCGHVGLCKAALAFDPARGRFETYATFRIRGHIIDDFLRRQTPAMLPTYIEPHNEPPGRAWLTAQRDCADPNRDPLDPSPNAEDVMIDEEEQERRCRHLAFASAHVGEEELRAVTMKYMDGKTLHEIGAAAGRSAGWAHNRLHSGKQQLREALLATSPE